MRGGTVGWMATCLFVFVFVFFPPSLSPLLRQSWPSSRIIWLLQLILILKIMHKLWHNQILSLKDKYDTWGNDSFPFKTDVTLPVIDIHSIGITLKVQKHIHFALKLQAKSRDGVINFESSKLNLQKIIKIYIVH